MNEILNQVLEDANGVMYTDDMFALPEEEDFFNDGYSFDLKNAINECKDASFFVEEPFSKDIGYYNSERAFIIKANRYKDVDEDTYGKNYKFTSDGDTIYFDNNSLLCNNTAFPLGDRTFNSLADYINKEKNPNGKFGVRFVGIDTPEIPHMTEAIIDKKDIKIMTYGELKKVKDKNKYTYLEYELKGITPSRRNDSDKIYFYHEPIEDKYYEIDCSLDFSPKSNQDMDRYERVLYYYKTDSDYDTVEYGIKAANDVVKLIDEAEDIRIILDAQSLNRKSNNWSSPYSIDYNKSTWLLSPALQYAYTLYSRFFSDERYKYLGFNNFGEDNNKRFLGAVYVKTKVPELDDKSTWINLNKYILYKYQDSATALPSYSSDPKKNDNNNYISDALKLWTYNLNNKEELDFFTEYTDDFINDRNNLFKNFMGGMEIEQLKDYTVILGDNIFVVPPTSIRLISQLQQTATPLLRSRGSAIKETPINDRQIELKLFFNDKTQINGIPYTITAPNGVDKIEYHMNGLRGLIAQFKLAPFLPIENEYINNVLDIDAVCLTDLQVSTVVGYPRLLQATLLLKEFDWTTYMPEIPVDTENTTNIFARCIHYPLFRWYYQRLIMAGEEIKNLDFTSHDFIDKTFGSRTALIPMDFTDSTIEFYLPDKNQLDRRLQIELEKQSKPLNSNSYKLSDEEKEFIRGMANFYGDVINNNKNADKSILKNAFAPLRIDIPEEDREDCYTLKYNSSTGKMEEINDNPKYAYFYTYFNTNPSSTDTLYFRKMLPSCNTAVQVLADRYATSDEDIFKDSWQNDYEGMNPVGTALVNPLINDYFSSIYNVNYGLKTIKDNQGARVRINVIMPTKLQNPTEIYMLRKKAITDLQLTDADDLFTVDSYGNINVVLDYVIPDSMLVETSDGTIVYSDNEEDYANALRLSTDCKGLQFLNWCANQVEKATTDDGNDIYLGYVGNGIDEETEKLDEYNHIESADSIDFIKYDIGDVKLSTLNIGYTNNFATVRLSASETAAMQFCGGQDIAIDLSITTRNKDAVYMLTKLPKIASQYMIDYREILPFWSLRIKTELTKMFGVNEVMIQTVDTSTVDNFPGLYVVSMRLIAVDRSTRNREALKKLEDINNSGLINNETRGYNEIHTYFDINKVLSKTEIYPDLELPLVTDIEKLGYTMTRYYGDDNRKFVDPDFYFINAHTMTSEIYKKAVLNSLNVSQELKGCDTLGGMLQVELTKSVDGKNIIKEQKQNDTSKQVQDAYVSAYNDMNTDFAEVLTKTVWSELDEAQKIATSLSTATANLATPIWNLTNDYIFPLRETFYNYTTKNENSKNIYKETLQKVSNSTVDYINSILKNKIKTDNIYTIDFKKKAYEKAYKEGRSKINSACTKINASTIEDEIPNVSVFIPRGEEVVSSQNCSVDKITGVFSAYADAISGAGIADGQTMAWYKSDDEQDLAQAWKFRTMIASPNSEDGNIVPYCLTFSREYATSFEDAVSNGMLFGPFGIQMYKKEFLAELETDEYERKRILNSNSNYMFLDPYYRDLQINSSNSEEIREYKENLLNSPYFGAIAYFRNILYLYKKLVKENDAISIFELVRNEVAGYSFVSQKNEKSGQVIDTQTTKSKTALAQYEVLFKENAKLYAKGYCYLYPDISKTKEALLENGIPENLINYIIEQKKCSKEEIQTAINDATKKKKLIEDTLQKDGTSTETNSFRIKQYEQQIEVLTNVISDDTSKAESSIVAYGINLAEWKMQIDREIETNNQTFEQVVERINKSNEDIILGKIIGLSIILLSGDLSIIDNIKNRDTASLDTMISNALKTVVDGNYAIIRKYIFALNKEIGMDIDYIGVSNNTPESIVRAYAATKIYIERSNSPKYFLRDSFLDMVRNDKRGRMIRAFPTYYLMFVDEGRQIGYWKLHDNFYNMNAISEFTITKSRKIAADTCEIVMSNLYKTYSANDEEYTYNYNELYSANYTMKDAFNSFFSPRTYAIEEETKRTLAIQPRTAEIKPGVRIHLRMGYGANAGALPVVFNGVIAEVGTDTMVDIVAQSDGIELLNPITDVDDAEDMKNKEQFFLQKVVDNWLTNGASPREIMLSVLTSKGTWLQKLIRDFTKGRFYSHNPYGIFHFGDMDFTDIFSSGEVGQNIFEATPRLASFGESEKYFGLEEEYDTKAVPNISMHLIGKTFWDVMHICRSVQPDYICSVAPFGMRSTIFYGSPRYYYAYEYTMRDNDNGGQTIVERRKPFQQYHIYTSYGDIIHNNIRASSKRIKTNAVGFYEESKIFSAKTKSIGPLFVDFSKKLIF